MPAEGFWGDVDGDGDSDGQDDLMAEGVMHAWVYRAMIRRKVSSGEPLTKSEEELWQLIREDEDGDDNEEDEDDGDDDADVEYEDEDEDEYDDDEYPGMTDR